MFQIFIKYLLFVIFLCISKHTVYSDDVKTDITLNDWILMKNGWPLQDPYDKEVFAKKTLFYYSKDNANPLLKFQIKPELLEGWDEKTLFRLSFKYWSHEDESTHPISSIIKIDNYFDQFLDLKYKTEGFPGHWLPMEYILSADQMKKFMIDINAGGSDSLFAYKDIKVEFVTNEKDNEDIEDKEDNYEYQIQNITIKKSGKADVPKQSHPFDIDMNKNEDICFNIKYQNSEDIEFNVKYNVKDDSDNKNTILTVKPMNTEGKDSYLYVCLKQLIALSAKQLEISFDVKHYENQNDFTFDIEINDKNKYQLNAQKFLRMNGKEWDKEWTELSSNVKLFDMTDDSVVFKAATKSRIPASAHLVSNWMEYNPHIHDLDGEYSIEVDNSLALNGFRVRPKVCDWLSHCVDVLNTKVDQIKDDKTSKVTLKMTFKFSPFDTNTQYIKMHFYVEYFKPSYVSDSESYSSSFKLSLTHFGDPCANFGKTCTPDNTLPCDSNPFGAVVPNQPICHCKAGFLAPDCKSPDACDAETNSGGKACHKFKAECDPIPDAFRCLCVNGDGTNVNNIIWDPTSKKCTALTKDKDTIGWDQTTPGTAFPMNPSKKDNKLVYKFEINPTKHDVCLEMTYTVIKEGLTLEVDYNKITLFNIDLGKTATEGNTYKFCVRDFIYKVDDKFEMSLSVGNVDETVPTQFVLTALKPTLTAIKKTEVGYIDSWDIPKDVEPVKPDEREAQHWISLPISGKLNPDDKNPLSYDFKIPKDSKSSHLFVSDWIKLDNGFGDAVLDFNINYPKGTAKNLAIDVYIIYQKDDELKKSKSIWDKKTDTGDDLDQSKSNKNVKIPGGDMQMIKDAFKVQFEVGYDGKYTGGDIDISVKGMSFGDGCHSMDDKPVCNDDDIHKGVKCQRLGVNDKRCKCDEQLCHRFPSVTHFDQRCEIKDNGKLKWKCLCSENESDKDNYVWSQDDGKCVQNFFYKTNRKACVDKDCPITNIVDFNGHWANENVPQIDSKVTKWEDIYYTMKKGAKLNIGIKELTEKYDVCLNVKYSLTSTSKLEIAYKDNKGIELSTYTPESDVSQGINNELCVRSLTKNIDNNFDIKLTADLKADDSDVIALQLSPTPVELPKPYEALLEFLPQWTGDDGKNLWPLRYPEWVISKTNSFDFNAKSTAGKQSSYLMSSWLYKNIDGYKLRFKVNKMDDLVENEDFSIEFVVYDETMAVKPVLKDVIITGAKLPKGPVVVPIPKMDTDFRVALKVTYSVKSLKSLFYLSAIDLGDPCVKDDTSFNKCNDHGTCTRKGVVVTGKVEHVCDCTDQNWLTEDDCLTKDYCLGKDKESDKQKYCTTNDFGDCHNGGHLDTFYCDCKCKDNTPCDAYWVPKDYSSDGKDGCKAIPKCISEEYNYMSEVCVESKEGKGYEIKCNTLKGYINIGDEDNRNCVRFDVCDDVHREKWNGEFHGIKTNLTIPVCEDKAECYVTKRMFGTDEMDAYKCVCKPGYTYAKGDGNKFYCKPLLCELPSLNDCQQQCVPDPTQAKGYKCECSKKYYDLDGDNCKLKDGKKCDCGDGAYCDSGDKNCLCKTGFTLKDNKCVPNENYRDKDLLLLCPSGKVNATDKTLICNCGNSFEQKDELCKYKSLCGDGSDGQKDCAAKNAICNVVADGDDMKYQCDKCLPGMVKENGNDVCVEYCEMNYKNNMNRNTICKSINAVCNPIVAPVDGQSQSPKDFCTCNPGSVGQSDVDGANFICIVATNSVQFSLIIKNTFYSHFDVNYLLDKIEDESKPFGADLNGFYTELKSNEDYNRKRAEIQNKKLDEFYRNDKIFTFIEKIIENSTPFKGDNIHFLSMTTCEPINGEKYYNCLFTISLKKPLAEIEKSGKLNEKVEEICVKDTGNKKYCFFPNYVLNIKPPGSRAMENNGDHFIIDLEELQKKDFIKSFEACKDANERNVSLCDRMSNCEDIKDTSLYSCVCDKEYFEESDKTTIPVIDNTKPISLSKCSVKTTLCDGCSKNDHATCLNSEYVVQKDDKTWFVDFRCDCADKYKKSSNESNFQCLDVCSGACSNGGTCNYKGKDKYSCVCEDGYFGEHCDDKLGHGGWIAAVSVLGVAVLIASALAGFLFMRRRKNRNNSSGRHLDELSDTSYRVRQQSSGV